MNLRECYEAMGADFDAVLFRLRSEGLIKKFVLKFVDDPSYSQLEQTMQAEDYKEAFRAAHTIKGVAQNMGFDGLSQSSSDLTECLRPAGEDKATRQLTSQRQIVSGHRCRQIMRAQSLQSRQ